jgi:hypothetical protein
VLWFRTAGSVHVITRLDVTSRNEARGAEESVWAQHRLLMLAGAALSNSEVLACQCRRGC